MVALLPWPIVMGFPSLTGVPPAPVLLLTLADELALPLPEQPNAAHSAPAITAVWVVFLLVVLPLAIVPRLPLSRLWVAILVVG
jgi:hypothetical protein